MKQLAVLGGGSWGTALAMALSPRFESVKQWAYEVELAAQMQQIRENQVFLPGFLLPENLTISHRLSDTVADADVLLCVVPSHHLRTIFTQVKPYLSSKMLIVSATKGIENGTLLRMSEVIFAVTGYEAAVLSGPSFAKEVARNEPTACVIASQYPGLARTIQATFATPIFRLYANSDPVGTEIGGAVKNVMAIASGVCHGLGYGSNTMSALITRGLAEMTRLAVSLGGEAQTLSGLAGVGDLVLTTTGGLSRNRSVGIELAKGRTLDDIIGSTKMVAEGVETTRATRDLGHKQGVDMPITNMVHAVLFEGKAPKRAIAELMERALKME